MAATNFTPISLYYSTTASAVPTSGNLANGELALNIADMKLYAKNSAGTVTLLASNAAQTNVSTISFGSTGLTPSTATSGAVTVAGILAVANGGTGTATPALVQGTGVTITGSWPNQTINATGTGGTVTSVGGTGTVNGLTLTGTVTTSGSLTLGGTLSGVNLTSQVTGTLPIANGGTGTTSTTFANLTTNVTGTLPVANGGTGLATLTANNVVLGNGTSAVQFVAPSTTGNVLTSNGTTWQSSAPAGGGGATAQYSIVGGTANGTWTNIAFNPADLATGNYSVVPANVYLAAGNERSPIKVSSPRWSSYYQRWYGVGQYTSTDNALYFSEDGLYWNPVLYDLASFLGATNFGGGETQPNVAIDDSNGRIFFYYGVDGVTTVGYTTTATGSAISLAGTTTFGSLNPTSLQYVKMSTTGASGMVLVARNDTTTGYIYTCSAGATTWTQRLTFTAASNITEMALHYEENGKIFVPTNRTAYAFTTSGNITSGWTAGTAPADTDSPRCVGNGYFVFFDGATLYYSTTGATGSWTSVSTGVSATRVFYTGSVFLALTDVSGSGVQTINTTSNNTPITWSTFNGGTNIYKTLSLNGTNFGQRMTAT